MKQSVQSLLWSLASGLEDLRRDDAPSDARKSSILLSHKHIISKPFLIVSNLDFIQFLVKCSAELLSTAIEVQGDSTDCTFFDNGEVLDVDEPIEMKLMSLLLNLLNSF